ncbi:hypothetical protein BT96DRAFT_777974, partial [Gymnopus androsaceus JB14]
DYVPSTEDLGHLKARRTEPQLQLTQSESELARVQSLLDDILLQQETVKKYVDAHRALMSPMRRIPAETLAEILVCCLPDDQLPVRDLAEAPLLFTTVSREWRRTAIATPALWDSLH